MAEEIDFTPFDWEDNSRLTAWSAARGPRRLEKALAEIIEVLKVHRQDIDAAGAGVGGGGSGAPLSGLLADAPQPGVGVLYNATDIGELVKGDGAQWCDLMGTPVTTLAAGGGGGGTGGGTTVPAPPGARLTVTGPNTFDCDADPVTVTGQTVTYTLFEDASLSGVSGAIDLSTPHTTRNPTSARAYRYWWRAKANGVLSPISEYMTVTLPTDVPGGGGGGAPGTQPADVLNIGTGATQNHYDVGVGYPSGHVNHTQQEIIDGYNEVPYFTLNGTSDAVKMRVPTNGGKTSPKTSYPRVELREYRYAVSGSTTEKADWDATQGLHELEVKGKLLHIPPNKPWMTIGQIHNTPDDTLGIKIRNATINGGGPLYVVASIYGTEHATKMATTYTLGDQYWYKVVVSNSGELRLYWNDVLKITVTTGAFKNSAGEKQYFKAGAYMQTATTAGGFESATEYGEIEMSYLRTLHTPNPPVAGTV